MNQRIQNTINALKKNNMDAVFAATKEDAVNALKKQLKKGMTVAVGGSVTLDTLGVIEMLRSGEYNFIDRYEQGIDLEERKKRFKQAFFADAFLTSSNAITEKGELVNVDGNGNRVAALIYGPEKVIVVASVNKIVADAEEGFHRIKTTAAPKNCVRLSVDSYCKGKGVCMAADLGDESLGNGCLSPNRICCTYTVSAYQRIKDRIFVIICGEDLGY